MHGIALPFLRHGDRLCSSALQEVCQNSSSGHCVLQRQAQDRFISFLAYASLAMGLHPQIQRAEVLQGWLHRERIDDWGSQIDP